MTGTSLMGRTSARVTAVVSMLLLLAPVTPAHAATGVRTTRAVEFAPSAGRGALAWTEAPRAHPMRTRAMARLGDGSAFRLSARGQRGFTAGGAIDEGGNRIAYWQHDGGKGNIKIFKVSSRNRRPVRFVNTARHEWGASVSGKRLLFARGRYGGTMTLLLGNLDNHNVRRLARVGSSGYLQPGDVSGRWATWTRCRGFRNCSVIRLNVRNGNRKVLGNPKSRSQFASSVLRNGKVFYGESRNYATCGSALRLYKAPRSGPRSHLETLPSGTSIAMTSVKRVSSSAAHVYFDQSRCSTGAFNIYRIRAGA